MDEETRIRYGDNYFLIKSKNRVSDVLVDCSLDLDFLKSRMYRPFESETQTLKSVLTRCLPSGWVIKGAETVTPKRTIRLDAATDYDVIRQVMSTYDVEFQWNTVQKILTVVKPEESSYQGEYLTDELNLKQLTYKGDTASFSPPVSIVMEKMG